ncbi:MAG: glycosyltransferase family 39 protein [Streptococcaceae bacterium]|nr:glycosyltransferase family 39 protein [Streptococcaceae bacterium]
MQRQKIQRFTARKSFWFGLLGLIWLGINTYVITQIPEWNLRHILGFLLGNLCFFVAAFYLWGLYRLTKHLSALTDARLTHFYKLSALIVGLTVLIVPFFLVIHVPDSAHNWDFFEIFVNTSLTHGGSFQKLPMTEDQLLYFLRYPNNQFFGMLYNSLFGPLDTPVKIWVLTAVSAILTSSSVLAGSLLVKKIMGKRHALLYNAAAFGFVPFYVYGAQFYTDTASLPFVLFGLLFMVYALNAENRLKQLLWWSLACLIVFIGYNIKPTVAIPMVAVFVFLLVIKRDWKKMLLFVPVSLVLFGAVHVGIKSYLATEPAFSAQANNRYNLPLVHWVTMSLSPENKYGGFNPAVLAYSESFPDIKSKQAGDVKLLVTNLKKMGVSGLAVQLWRKIMYTWFNGDLSDFFYTYRHQNPVVFYLFDWTSFKPSEGNVAGWLLIKAAQSLYWLAIVPLMWYEIGLSIWKKRQTEGFILGLSMIGLTGFLLIWEANSRYLYNFAPIMLALAICGLIDFLARKKKGGKHD